MVHGPGAAPENPKKTLGRPAQPRRRGLISPSLYMYPVRTVAFHSSPAWLISLSGSIWGYKSYSSSWLWVEVEVGLAFGILSLVWVDPGGGGMALRGVWQLQKLVVNYCDWGGSSRGIRAFMETHLPDFKEKNPHLEVVTELVRGQHPNLKGIYKNHNERVVCVRNLAPEDIRLQATRLRNSLGRKVVKLRTRHVTKRPSVQGTWTTELKM